MKGVKEPIRLRQRKLKDGSMSLYLDCYYMGRRSNEFLSLYLIPERTQLDKERNRTTMLQAEAHKARRIIELQQGRYGVVQGCKINRVKLSEYVEQTGKHYQLSETAARQYKETANDIRRFGDTYLQQVDKRYIEDFIKHLGGCNGRYNRPLKPSTQELKLRKLNSSLNRATREGLIISNPLGKVEKYKRPHAQATERTYLTLAEVEQLINTECKRGSVKRAFLFACFCGLRSSDVRALRWCDIKPTKDGGKQIEKTQQKTGQRVYLPLSPNALKWLPDRPKGSKETDRVFYVLPNVARTRTALKNWAKDARLTKHLSFHVSRHTFATLLLTYGADLYTTSKLLGHTNVTTTQIYAKIIDEKKAQAVNMIPTV